MLRQVSVMYLLAMFLTVGCGSDGKSDVSQKRFESMTGKNMKKVVPVSGTVTIDGTPAANVYLYLHPSDGDKNPLAECKTDDKGAYCWTTYTKCDGIEPGEYKIAFKQMMKAERKSGTGIDELKGRYSNPKKVDINLSVKPDTPQKDVKYELTSK